MYRRPSAVGLAPRAARGRARAALHLLLLGGLLAAWEPARARQAPQDAAAPGVGGYVLAPDGSPVPDGTLTFRNQADGATTSIERTGRFRFVPYAPGPHDVHVSVPGLAPFRVIAIVPASRTLSLPPIHLSPPTYVRVRFVSAAGEPVVSPRVIRQSFDARGALIWESPGAGTRDTIDADGAITIGPLPRGVTTMALDAPPLARVRLPDVRVTGETPVIDGGTVIVDPGAVLHVDVVDQDGAPVPGHGVLLEDAAPFSPLHFNPARTDENGRVTFDRLAAGRYRIGTRSARPCGDRVLAIVRDVSVSGTGRHRMRLVVGGRATFRFTSSGVPVTAASVSVTPEPPPSPPAPWVRRRALALPVIGRPFWPVALASPCVAAPDRNGRVALDSFPPGPARIDLRLPNSTWVRRVNVPGDGREIPIEVPGGYLPLRASNAATGAPVARATVVWTAGGARVEAATSAGGEALLEAAGAAGGTLAIDAPGYRARQIKLGEPPAVLYDVALEPERDAGLECRVIDGSGQPLPGAVVELVAEDPIETPQVAAADANGIVRFFDAPTGAVRVAARADGHVVASMRIPARATGDAILTLSRGHRVMARVEATTGAGPHLVRILDDEGASLDDLLDAGSDRLVHAPGVVSLGPLPPGAYILELRSGTGRRQERVLVDDRDAHVTFR